MLAAQCCDEPGLSRCNGGAGDEPRGSLCVGGSLSVFRGKTGTDQLPVVAGEDVACQRGGKEVHAADVARAAGVLLDAKPEAMTGECFNCYDLYVSQWDVAHLAKQASGSSSQIRGQQTTPKHEIVTEKLRALGMEFGGQSQLKETIRELAKAAESL